MKFPFLMMKSQHSSFPNKPNGYKLAEHIYESQHPSHTCINPVSCVLCVWLFWGWVWGQMVTKILKETGCCWPKVILTMQVQYFSIDLLLAFGLCLPLKFQRT